MTTISGPGGIDRSRFTARARPGTTTGFVVPEDAAAASRPAAAASASAACGPLDLMLALQEAESRTQRDRRARRHGEALLAALGRLQRGMLGAGQPPLEELAALVSGAVPDAADPALRTLLRGVALRARVELARHGA